MPLAAYQALCVDAPDAQRGAGSWAAALGLEVGEDRGAVVRLDGPRPEHRVRVNQVPEPAAAHNRLHLDVHTGAVADLLRLGATVRDDSYPWTVLEAPDGVDRLVEHGARPLRPRGADIRWHVLADPEGNEFCAFTP